MTIRTPKGTLETDSDSQNLLVKVDRPAMNKKEYQAFLKKHPKGYAIAV